MPLRDEMRVARCRSRWVAGAWPWGRAGRPGERSAIKVPFEIHDRGEGAPPRTEKGFSDSETCGLRTSGENEDIIRIFTIIRAHARRVKFTLNL
jgi:hypothetical protein